MLEELERTDPEIARLVRGEAERQMGTLELIASENFTSPAVLEAMGSVLTNKYAEGYPGHRYYGGCEIVDEAEELARSRAKALFGAEHVNVQPHSGSQANMAVYEALLAAKDRVLGLSLATGGHLTHGSPVNFSGKHYEFIGYGVDPDTEQINYDELRHLAREVRPRMIVTGASAYPRTLDFARFRSIADEVGALLMVDMAHIAGLVATGAHPSPVPYADVVTTTTHKTLRGPRGGMILCREAYAKKIDSAIFPGIQGGPLMHVIAAKAVAFGEALRPEFHTYIDHVVENARVMAEEMERFGWRLVAKGTDTHLFLLSFVDRELTGREAERALGVAGITVNKNTVPGETRSPRVTSGVRIGTPAITTRGMGTAEMRQIASLMDRVLGHPGDETVLAEVRRDVEALCARFPFYAKGYVKNMAV